MSPLGSRQGPSPVREQSQSGGLIKWEQQGRNGWVENFTETREDRRGSKDHTLAQTSFNKKPKVDWDHIRGLQFDTYHTSSPFSFTHPLVEMALQDFLPFLLPLLFALFSLPLNICLHFVRKQTPALNFRNSPTSIATTSQSYFKFDIFYCANTKKMGSIGDPLHSLLIRPESRRAGKRAEEDRGVAGY